MVIRSVNLETVCGITSKIPDNPFNEVAFAGKSNVGKSSMINALLNRKSLARTSAQPGKTQTINFYNVNDAMYLVDLPGYGYAKTSASEKEKWGKMIENYLHTSKKLQAVFLLIDIRHDPSANDKMMYDWMVYQGFTPIIIATKLDKIKRSQIQKNVKAIREGLKVKPGTVIIPFSSETKQGRDELWEVIDSFVLPQEETEEEDDFEDFDFMMFSQLEDTRDVLFAVLQDRSLPLTLRISVSEQLTESYQNCIEEGRQFDIDDLLRECERHQKEGSLSEFISKHLSEKGADAASLHQWNRQKKELQVLRGLERLRPEWNQILDGAEKWLYQENEETYKNICKEFHQMYGALSNYKEEWENVGEQLMMFFVYTYFCGAVYDDMVCSKMEMALFSIRWVQEFLIVRWLENGKTLSMKDVEEISWRYAREVEHSDNNLNTLEDWLFENYYLIH